MEGRIEGVSYTDTVRGLDKIKQLCEFFKFRGDCHHVTEAAQGIQALLERYPAQFQSASKGSNGSLSARGGDRGKSS